MFLLPGMQNLYLSNNKENYKFRNRYVFVVLFHRLHLSKFSLGCTKLILMQRSTVFLFINGGNRKQILKKHHFIEIKYLIVII